LTSKTEPSRARATLTIVESSRTTVNPGSRATRTSHLYSRPNRVPPVIVLEDVRVRAGLAADIRPLHGGPTACEEERAYKVTLAAQVNPTCRDGSRDWQPAMLAGAGTVTVVSKLSVGQFGPRGYARHRGWSGTVLPRNKPPASRSRKKLDSTDTEPA